MGDQLAALKVSMMDVDLDIVEADQWAVQKAEEKADTKVDRSVVM
jgi:hypothetical protein